MSSLCLVCLHVNTSDAHILPFYIFYSQYFVINQKIKKNLVYKESLSCCMVHVYLGLYFLCTISLFFLSMDENQDNLSPRLAGFGRGDLKSHGRDTPVRLRPYVAD